MPPNPLRRPRPLRSALLARPLVAHPFLTASERQLWALPLAGYEANASDRWEMEGPAVELLYSGRRLDEPSTQAHIAFSRDELEALAVSPPERYVWRQSGNDRIAYTPRDAKRLLAVLDRHLSERDRAARTLGPRQRLSGLSLPEPA